MPRRRRGSASGCGPDLPPPLPPPQAAAGEGHIVGGPEALLPHSLPGALGGGVAPAIPRQEKIGVEGVYHVQAVSIMEEAIIRCVWVCVGGREGGCEWVWVGAGREGCVGRACACPRPPWWLGSPAGSVLGCSPASQRSPPACPPLPPRRRVLLPRLPPPPPLTCPGRLLPNLSPPQQRGALLQDRRRRAHRPARHAARGGRGLCADGAVGHAAAVRGAARHHPERRLPGAAL